MKVIIIGAVAAGSKVAAKLNRLQPNWNIIIYTQDTHISYSECGMPYYIAGSIKDINKLVIRTPKEFEQKGVKVFTQHKVIKLLPNTKEILVENLKTKEIFYEKYDKLVISTGAKPFKPNIEGIELENVFTLRSLEDGVKIKNAVLKNKNATILGCGYIGIELLEAFVKQGLVTNVIQADNFVMSVLDNELAEIIQKYIIKRNLEQVKILNNTTIKAIVGKKRIEKLILSNDKEIKTDFLVMSIGVRPNVELVKNTEIKLGTTGAIKVNPKMETTVKDIYACGDCVEKHHIVANSPCWIPLGSTSNKEGRCCAINVAGGNDSFDGVLGSVVTRYFDYTISMTGLTEKQAIKYGFEPVSEIIKKNDRASYMPNVETVMIKLVADKNTHKILGAQGIGLGDVDKRINTLTSALLSKMTVKEFFENDLTYAPPFSPSIDPLLTVSQNLLKKLK